MKLLKEILNTPLEELHLLSERELDLFFDGLEPDFDIEKVHQDVYRFRVKNLLYQVDITISVMSNEKKMIEIKFRLLNNPGKPHRNSFQSDQQYQVALRKSEVGVTGTGNPLSVFKKVFGAVITSIKDIQPDYIVFSADENNRQGLYNKFIEILSPYIPFKYKKIEINPLTGDRLGEEEFWLEKQV